MKPTKDSVDLALTILEGDNPLLEYVAIIICRTMELNYECVTDMLERRREAFKALGAEEMF